MTPALYRSERLKRGLSQAALAALVGVSRGCVNYREAGHPRYPITVEARLAVQALPKNGKKGGRPVIPGKGKYTLTLMKESVEAFYETESNLSGFVDSSLEAFLKKRRRKAGASKL